jgi:hypothetical protein
MALATKWVVTFNAGVLCEKAAKRSLQRSFAVLLSPSLSPSLARLICIHVNTNTPLSCIFSRRHTESGGGGRRKKKQSENWREAYTRKGKRESGCATTGWTRGWFPELVCECVCTQVLTALCAHAETLYRPH